MVNPEIDDVDHDTVPPANKGLLAIAGVLLALPMIALAWVGSYARIEPKFAGFPFFIWYQFLWVFLCSACDLHGLQARAQGPPAPADARPPRRRDPPT